MPLGSCRGASFASLCGTSDAQPSLGRILFPQYIFQAAVVGYQEIPLDVGYTIFAPTFDGVGKALDIQDIKLQGVPGEGSDLIWVLSTEGQATGDTYYWFSDDILPVAGWSEDGENMLERELVSGEAFYFYTETEGAKALVSGQVHLGDFEKELEVGYNLTGNFTPIARDIQTIKIEGVPGEGSDLVWVLNAEGQATGDTYYWFSDDILPTPGWSEDGEDMMTKEIEPGEGLYFYTETAGAKIKIPAIAIK